MRKIIIDIEGGCVVGHSNMPKGYFLQINDFDAKAIGDEWQSVLM
tara:strand:- start:275 stop:409 length:135 start_codon:yes stop_codon:yes gene_type:complete